MVALRKITVSPQIRELKVAENIVKPGLCIVFTIEIILAARH